MEIILDSKYKKLLFVGAVYKDNGCIEYPWCLNKRGYGLMNYYGARPLVHRVSYELFNNSKIIKGYEIDHICRVRNCINPNHLEMVTKQENLRRARIFLKVSTHCRRGHELSNDNIYYLQRGNGKKYRQCIKCGKLRMERWLENNKEHIIKYRRNYQASYIRDYKGEIR